MKTPLLAALACLAAACTPILEATTYDPARSVIEPAVAGGASPEQAARIADCVILNATRPELVRIASDATKLDGPAPDVADLIADILGRPQTQACARG